LNKIFKVRNTADLGVLFKKNPHQMVGQDGAYSFKLNEKETFWFFGDTFIGDRIPGESLWYPGGKAVGPKDMSGIGRILKMHNNTGLLSTDTSGSNGVNSFSYITDDKGEIRPLIELLPEEHPDEIRVWCLHGIAIDQKVYLFFIKVKMIEEGIFPVNFEILGSGIAVGDPADMKFTRIVHNNSDILWGKYEPKFAAAVFLNEKDNLIYLYGVVQENSVQNCYLSRVAPDKISSIFDYEYYCGNNNWDRNISKAAPLFTGMPNELSVSFNKYLNCFLAVHSHDLSGNIVGRVSQTPWGPWSEPEVLFSVKINREKELPYPVLIYAGKEHPSLSDEDGKIIYLTYIEFEEYFPHLVRVELERL
jgi:hypothetical protein